MQLLKNSLVAWVSWMVLATTHLMVVYLDSLKRQPDYIITTEEYVYYLLAYSSWALTTVLLYQCMKLRQWPLLSWQIISLFGLGMLVWLPTFFIFDHGINAWLYGRALQPFSEVLANLPNALVFFYAMLYALMFGACTTLVYYQRLQRSQLAQLVLHREQLESQLLLLQSQLGPHFMFNCLGAISALVRQGEKRALLSAVASIGELLRFSLENSSHPRIRLSDELDFVEHYIKLQSLRFGERFEFLWSQETQSPKVLVPAFTIQPLIENAFTHGVEQREATTQIELRLSQTAERVRIEVVNTLPNTPAASNGIGSALNNLHKRLSLLYADKFSLEQSEENGLYRTIVTLPNETEIPAHAND